MRQNTKYISQILGQRNVLFIMVVALVFLVLVLLARTACADVIVLGGAPSTVVPSGQLSTHVYTSPGVTTIQPPVGLPTHVYHGPTANSPTTVVPPGQLPTFIYGR